MVYILSIFLFHSLAVSLCNWRTDEVLVVMVLYVYFLVLFSDNVNLVILVEFLMANE